MTEYCDEVKKMLALLEQVRKCHHDVVATSYLLRDMVTGKTATIQQMCDAGYLSRECVELLNEARKEIEAQQKRLGTVIAATMTNRLLQDPTLDPRVLGDIAGGTPDVKTHPRIPAKGSPKYYALLEWLGVPVDVAKKDVLDFSFNRLTELLGAAVAEGRLPPPSVVDTYQEYVTTYRLRKKDGIKA